MSGRNDGMNGASLGLAMLACGAILAGLLLFALAVFASVVFTVLAVIAWDKPLRIGKQTIYPKEARAFIGGALTGAVAVPMFAAFCSILFDFRIEDAYWVYIAIGGYAAGGLGTIMALSEMEEEEPSPPAPQSLPQPIAPPPEKPKAPRRPFDFADWDDDEMR